MKERINVAELLKYCPKGMELDCMMYENVEFDYIEQSPELAYPIHCITKTNGGYNDLVFTHNGCNDRHPNAKCVIFPKGKTTWDGFVPPCKYKAGDVLVSEKGNIVLLSHIDSDNIVHYHCIITTYGSFRIEENTGIGVGKYYQCVLANEQQRQRMYDRIKCSGYKYNQHINKLEKLIIPNFKKGDKVRVKKGVSEPRIIDDVCDTFYTLIPIGSIDFTDQDKWELVPNKFDITTLKPFESRVLVRNVDGDLWKPAIYGFPHSKGCYVVGGVYWGQCIPYEENKELLGTTNNPEEYGSR